MRRSSSLRVRVRRLLESCSSLIPGSAGSAAATLLQAVIGQAPDQRAAADVAAPFDTLVAALDPGPGCRPRGRQLDLVEPGPALLPLDHRGGVIDAGEQSELDPLAKLVRRLTSWNPSAASAASQVLRVVLGQQLQ